MIRRDQSGTSGLSAIPEVSQLASVASGGFNPLFPIAVLFFVVVIPVFAVLLFFLPPVSSRDCECGQCHTRAFGPPSRTGHGCLECGC